MDTYGWVVVGHVGAVILLFAAHGVSMFAMFRVRKETDPVRIGAILDLSAGSLALAGIGLLLAFFLGIVAAVMGGHFSRFWPWAAIIVIVVVTGAMTPLAAMPMNRLRKALGAPVAGDRTGDTVAVAGTDEDLAVALAGIRPELPAAIGAAGVLILIWLMRAKPF